MKCKACGKELIGKEKFFCKSCWSKGTDKGKKGHDDDDGQPPQSQSVLLHLPPAPVAQGLGRYIGFRPVSSRKRCKIHHQPSFFPSMVIRGSKSG